MVETRIERTTKLKRKQKQPARPSHLNRSVKEGFTSEQHERSFRWTADLHGSRLTTVSVRQDPWGLSNTD